MNNKVAIIGWGVVGHGMAKIFSNAVIYDHKIIVEPDDFVMHDGMIAGGRDFINRTCGLAIICVPTPPKEEDTQFKEADTSIVEQTVRWLKTPYVLIKSTVPPGTTDRLNQTAPLIDEFGKRVQICFSPEYLGESKYYTPPEFPDPEDPRKHSFMVIGGQKESCNEILERFFIPRLGPSKHYHVVSAIEAELIKYLENTFFALKVTYCNEFYDICKAFGADYNSVREGWLFDERVGRMHSSVFRNKRGYDGKCYPKDVMALIAAAHKVGVQPKLLEAMHIVNGEMLDKNIV